jgi:Glycosyl hydrolases family 16
VDHLDERFDAPRLDPAIWIPAYLPAWSSTSAAAATYQVGSDGLRLSIPPEQPLWCPDLHADPPLRVSAVQSGNWSGPVGSRQGQQPFRNDLVVREAQDELRGFTPLYGRIEVEGQARIGPGSMFSAWMVGMEDEPDRSGEICLVEVFGDAIKSGSAAVGSGIHPFRDPALVEEFSAEPVTIDVKQSHRYAVDWRPDGVDFFLDGELTRSSTQSPDYPMLLILGVFDFPGQSAPGAVPELVITRVTGP